MVRFPPITDHYYHIYNRGVEKRDVFQDPEDYDRFLQSLVEFNTEKPIGSIFENFYRKQKGWLGGPTAKLVDIIAYCLNPNHYHLLLRQAVDGGISELMKRVGGGYTGYFNEKYDRNGVLFQGKYKRIPVESDSYLHHLSVYVNLNNRIHNLKENKYSMTRSSWNEYIDEKIQPRLCSGVEVILNHYTDNSPYKEYAMESLPEIQKNKQELKGWGRMLID